MRLCADLNEAVNRVKYGASVLSEWNSQFLDDAGRACRDLVDCRNIRRAV